MQQQKFIKRNCIAYAMNESLFGQSHAQLLNVMDEMQIHLGIRFERCYLIVTGLTRSCYMERLNMRRAGLLSQMNEVEAELTRMGEEQRFTYEICVLNYDYSKRFAIVISPEEDVNIRAVASRVHAIIDEDYARIMPDKPQTLRNITVCSGLITSYEDYQQAFTALRRLYDQAFFLRECDLITAKQLREHHAPYSMIEAERELAAISDALFLRDAGAARKLLDTLLLTNLKRAQDRQMLAEVMVFLKKRIGDLCLILGIPWTEEIGASLDMERFLCIEELHVNPTYLSHAFKQEMRVSITQYITRIRIEQAQRLLNESDLKVGEIAGRVGLSDPRYFNTVFKRQVGMTPSEYRERRS